MGVGLVIVTEVFAYAFQLFFRLCRVVTISLLCYLQLVFGICNLVSVTYTFH